MSVASRVFRLEEWFSVFESYQMATDDEIRKDAEAYGVPFSIMCEMHRRVVGTRHWDPAYLDLMDEVVDCYKEDPEEYRRRVEMTYWG